MRSKVSSTFHVSVYSNIQPTQCSSCPTLSMRNLFMVYALMGFFPACLLLSLSPCAEDPPPSPVRVTSRYVVLDTTADLVLEARFRGNFHSHDWEYNEDDPTFLTGSTSLFASATITNAGQTYTIPAGSDSLVVGYYGPSIVPTEMADPMQPTPENTVIVGSFGEYTEHALLTVHAHTHNWSSWVHGMCLVYVPY